MPAPLRIAVWRWKAIEDSVQTTGDLPIAEPLGRPEREWGYASVPTLHDLRLWRFADGVRTLGQSELFICSRATGPASL